MFYVSFSAERDAFLVIRILLCLCMGLLPAGCGPVTVASLSKQGDARLLTARETYSLTNQNTLLLQGQQGSIYLYFHDSGRVYAQDIRNNKDTGRWDVSEQGELCFRMRKWWFGDLRCHTLYNADNRYYLADSASVITYTAEMYAGDNQGLYNAEVSVKKSYRRSLHKDNPPPLPKKTARPDVHDNSFSTDDGGNNGESRDIPATVKWLAKNCPNCNLKGNDLSHADLIEANLGGADLAGSNLSYSNLRRANLQGANLRNADLRLANLPGANLQNADLRGADLKGANLIRADLRGAQTEDAVFDNALLDAVIGFPH